MRICLKILFVLFLETEVNFEDMVEFISKQKFNKEFICLEF